MREDINEEIHNLNAAITNGDVKIIKKHILYLRNECAKGSEVQNIIVLNQQLIAFVKNLLFPVDSQNSFIFCKDEQLTLLTWQLIANICVQNETSQSIVWSSLGTCLLNSFQTHPLDKAIDIKLMIVYNIFKMNKTLIDDTIALKTIITIWRRSSDEEVEINFEYLHLFFENFLVQTRSLVKAYTQLESFDKISLLDYITVYIRNDSPNGPISTFFLQFISKEFKIKSDCILKHCKSDTIEEIKPKEVYALLRAIASASGSEIYMNVYRFDNSLFLNVSSVLRCLIATGKESENLFTPMNKLEYVAPSSKNLSTKFESEISFELKTLLVRAIANLLYENEINQKYCADTNLLSTLFECTNMDARNPLVKEWSILAIRNACTGCTENQNTISQMTQKGIASNEILKELNLEMGSLRINPNM